MYRTRCRIMVVAGAIATYRLLKALLESQGYAVDRANNILAAFKLSQRRHYELFIIDACVPIILVATLAEWLKEQISAARIILISAFVDDALKESATQLGVPLLRKPFTDESLLALVADSVGTATDDCGGKQSSIV